ncbi:helix-turn-helix domain-containing protein [Cohnella zeiphila]|uniref:Helix-turn-helix transcriptional regulator n=1 Tax=Cohnella zeiphila TaxID=2761120 RepID=A0A7X0SSG7_9BACL|nr:AraC family transcriptional regulator [Cohnella zeiphila]MBB6735305.1 helix-turn-helix transcriptional regulator [Cohnella zeiphila]
MGKKLPEIDEAIAYIHRHMDEPIQLASWSRHVGYSPYHFIRLFKTQTGLSPHYYLSSIRLQRAKDLLIRTSLPVRDIAMQVGQQSLGSFTTRFAEKIGVTPAIFREQQNHVGSHLESLMDLSERGVAERMGTGGAEVGGTVRSEIPFQGAVFIGLFEKPIPENVPLHGTILLSLGGFQFSNVKPGTYYLMATSVSWGMSSHDILLPHATLRTRNHEPIIVESDEDSHRKQVTLHPPHPDDPPILVSLPLLMSRFLARTSSFLL